MLSVNSSSSKLSTGRDGSNACAKAQFISLDNGLRQTGADLMEHYVKRADIRTPGPARARVEPFVLSP